MPRRPLHLFLIATSVLVAATLLVVGVNVFSEPLALPALPGNAADTYRQANSLIRTNTANPALDALLRASRMTSCDWQLPLDGGLSVMTAALPRDTQRLAEASTARSRACFQAGRTTEALRDVLALMTLGRHVTGRTPSTYRLAGYGAEDTAIDAVAHHLYSLSRRQINGLREQLSHLPAPAPLADTVAIDKQLLVCEFQRAGADGSQKNPLFHGLWSVGQAGIATRMDQVARLTALPHDQFPAAWSRFRADVGDNFVGDVTKGYEKIRNVDDQLKVRRAMLLAAIEMRLAPAATPTAADPFTHKPFTNSPPADNGFFLEADDVPTLYVQ